IYVFSGGTDPSLLSLPGDDQQEVQRIGVRLRAGIACVDFLFCRGTARGRAGRCSSRFLPRWSRTPTRRRHWFPKRPLPRRLPTRPRRGRQGRSPRCIDRFDCDGGIAPAAGNPDLGMIVSGGKDRRKDELTHLRIGLAFQPRPGVFRPPFLGTTSDPMSAKRASSSPGAASSPEHAVTNAVLLAAALGWGF